MSELQRETELSKRAIDGLRRRLLAWYDEHRRDLPWRRTQDPYAIWISEIMLQQTRVTAVVDRYETFLDRFPSVHSLAGASEESVLALWSGLGYYRRARMLHKAAQAVVQEFSGVIPRTALELQVLPGIGAYTSAAIASIAFGERVAVVDGNVERVVQRLAGWGSDLRIGQAELARDTERLAGKLLDPQRPGDFNQSMMELGATVCLPKNPMCLVCPIGRFCKTKGEHPTQARAKMRSQDAAYALALRGQGLQREVLLLQRPSSETVMPGMWELPALRDLQVVEPHLLMTVRHAIMQVNYRVRIRAVSDDQVESLTVASGTRVWVAAAGLPALPLTGLARKVLRRAHLLATSHEPVAV